ncbi:MAG: hypothetical protein AB8G05_21655 [Oligoflexales bacterium]
MIFYNPISIFFILTQFILSGSLSSATPIYNDQHVNAELLLSTIERAKKSLENGEDIEFLVSDIYDRFKYFNKKENESPFVCKTYKIHQFQKRKYFDGCKFPDKFNGWKFQLGHTWMNRYWKFMCNWDAKNYDENCCQGICGSLVCAGFVPCFILEFALTPCIPSYYQGGKCCRLGLPISQDQEKEKLLQYLDTLQETLTLYLEKNKVSTPSSEKLERE